jgi:hypothetical protein
MRAERQGRGRLTTRAAGAALAVCCVAGLVLAPGSASRLDVDAGVLQSWTLPGPDATEDSAP